MRFLENPSYPFVPTRRRAYVVSGVLILISLVSFATRGFDLGIEFLGGMAFVVEEVEGAGVEDVRSTLTPVLGAEPQVQSYGADALIIRTTVEGETGAVQQRIVEGMEGAFGAAPQVLSTYIIGPSFADDIAQGAIYAVLGGLLVIFLYIFVRYEWRFGLGALAALAHDVIIALGVFSLLSGVLPFSLQIDQTIIAAFLTIVGYSVNDTVVVFDRIRESAGLYKTLPYGEVINRAINFTLARTIMTGVSVLIALVVLFIFGGETLRGFAFALIFGILIGSYSSVYIASPFVLELRAWTEGRERRRKMAA